MKMSDNKQKKMQQKAVRSHFICPTASGSRKNCSVDLFGYGKILQFLLAYTCLLYTSTQSFCFVMSQQVHWITIQENQF